LLKAYALLSCGILDAKAALTKLGET
jgi:hypothetical protein